MRCRERALYKIAIFVKILKKRYEKNYTYKLYVIIVV